MAPEEKTQKKAPKPAEKTKLICKGPGEVSVHLIDESIDLTTAADGKIGAGSVKGKVLSPGQCVDISEVPDYQISEEIKNGSHPGLELVTAQEASIYTPTPESDLVAGGMDVPRNNHMARPIPTPQ